MTDPEADLPAAVYGTEFAADPGHCYERLRSAHGEVAPVELAPGVDAMLVIGYRAALDVLRDPATFSRDPRPWQQSVPEDSPVLPLMEWQPTCQRTDGAEGTRYRAAIVDSLTAVDPIRLRAYLERQADTLITAMAPKGTADLIAEYVTRMVVFAITYLLGCDGDSADRLVTACQAVGRAVHGGNAAAGRKELVESLTALLSEQRRDPGPGIITRLLEQPSGLDDRELVHQLGTIVFATVDPEIVVIANTLLHFLSDERFGGDLAEGSITVDDAIEEVMWTDIGMNLGMSYPRQDLDFHGTRLLADRPVLISFAAASQHPSVSRDHTGNRAHLAWGAGPHSCPAQDLARTIATVTVERLLDVLPDMRLTVRPDQLIWQASPFFRTLTTLPVRFSPLPVTGRGADQEQVSPQPPAATAPPAESAGAVPPTSDRAVTRWRNAAVRWWNGR